MTLRAVHLNVVRKPATKLQSSKRYSPPIDTCSETREKTRELIKQAEAAIKRAEQTAETSSELLLEFIVKKKG